MHINSSTAYCAIAVICDMITLSVTVH